MPKLRESSQPALVSAPIFPVYTWGKGWSWNVQVTQDVVCCLLELGRVLAPDRFQAVERSNGYDNSVTFVDTEGDHRLEPAYGIDTVLLTVSHFGRFRVYRGRVH